MKQFMVMFILMMLAGCGSSYHLKTGGWKLGKVEGEGTCLVVHGDSDPEVVRVCIAKPEAFKLSAAVLKEHCNGAD
tara:strand:- start:1058 stop:1285 length:228 start_codon:yes stop_codon:yes gene_type:complete